MRRIATLCVLVTSLAACGVGNSRKTADAAASVLASSCILPNGQQDNSLQGQWQLSQLPLKVSLHSGSGWSATETSFLQASGGTWNGFFMATRGGVVLNLGTSGAPNTSSLNVSRPDCTQTSVSDGTVVYKRGTWTKGGSVIALTTFCVRNSTSGAIPMMYNAIIEFNYQHYFTAASGRFPDLQSIMTHELGHLLGLDHSCGTLRSGRSNADCPTAGGDALGLYESIMYPNWSIDGTSGLGEIKRNLNVNDQGRALCLY